MKTLPPDAVAVTVIGRDTLIVTFANDEKRQFDLKPLLHRKCYEKLNDPLFVSQAEIQYGCVTWPGEIDIDPEWLYEDSVAIVG